MAVHRRSKRERRRRPAGRPSAESGTTTEFAWTRHHRLAVVLSVGLVSWATNPACSRLSDEDRAEERTSGATDAAGNVRRANRLARESSPYLLLHAHNPVDWYPWGPEAFAAAKAGDKPVFLSIGYSSCYWCHVMERLVFSDENIAKYMNEHFINIKVDREERPDIDEIYMTALHVYLRSIGSREGGGWPLSVFLLADGRPFFGGTYFPPEDTPGRPGFSTVLHHVNQDWDEHRKGLERNAERITREVRRTVRPLLNSQPAKLSRDLVAAAATEVAASRDPTFGGLDFNPRQPDTPKFPVPQKLMFLLQQLSHSEDEQAADVIRQTLNHIQAGGIRDHLAGGFHRYSTDRRWLVPHFEKMLYDQAQMSELYATAWKELGEPTYRHVAEEAYDYVLSDLTDPAGGFYSALDAETDHIEGAYYVWSADEIESVLGPDDAVLFGEIYGLEQPNPFEHGHVLHLPRPVADVARQQGVEPDSLATRLQGMRRKLLNVRNQRPAPLRDDKVLCNWNGLMIRSLANGGRLLVRVDYVEAAERAAQLILTEMRDDQGRLLHSWTDGQARIRGMLNDYAFLVDGLLALHRTTGDQRWLTEARAISDTQIALFTDSEYGGFYSTSHDHEELIARTMNAWDSVIPSGNSVTARNMLRLTNLTEDQRYRDAARGILEQFVPMLEQAPSGMTNMASALSEYLDGEAKAAGEADSGLRHQPTGRQTGGSHPVETASAETEDEGSEAETTGTSSRPPVTAIALRSTSSNRNGDETPDYVKARAFLSVDRLPPGGRCEIVVFLDVAEDWHINANPASPDFLEPTRIEIRSRLGTRFTDARYPRGKTLQVEGFDESFHVYEGRVAIRGTLRVPDRAAARMESVEIKIHYQACNDVRCLQPVRLTLNGEIPVAGSDQVVQRINEALFQRQTRQTTSNGKRERPLRQD